MEDILFKIKITEREFVIDSKLEGFKEVGKNTAVSGNVIPIGQFRYKEGGWYILWDKEFSTYYDPARQRQFHSIPLSVEWVEVKFLDDKSNEKDCLDLIILLSETLWILRSRGANSRSRKTDNNLKKWLSQFNKS